MRYFWDRPPSCNFYDSILLQLFDFIFSYCQSLKRLIYKLHFITDKSVLEKKHNIWRVRCYLRFQDPLAVLECISCDGGRRCCAFSSYFWAVFPYLPWCLWPRRACIKYSLKVFLCCWGCQFFFFFFCLLKYGILFLYTIPYII